jgi:hypothetical protein
MGCMPFVSVYMSPLARIAEGATVSASRALLSGWATRPQCMIWATIRPPSLWTASVTLRQALT